MALGAGMGGTAAYAALAGSVPADQAQDHLVVRGGVVRLGTQLYLHANSAHAAIGISRIQLVNHCRLRVHFDRAAGERIVAAIAEEDEAMSRLGVQAGVSGGVNDATIFLYRKGKEVCANNRLFGNRSNIWISLTYLSTEVQQPADRAPAAPKSPTAQPSTNATEAPRTPATTPTPTVVPPTAAEPDVEQTREEPVSGLD